MPHTTKSNMPPWCCIIQQHKVNNSQFALRFISEIALSITCRTSRPNLLLNFIFFHITPDDLNQHKQREMRGYRFQRKLVIPAGNFTQRNTPNDKLFDITYDKCSSCEVLSQFSTQKMSYMMLLSLQIMNVYMVREDKRTRIIIIECVDFISSPKIIGHVSTKEQWLSEMVNAESFRSNQLHEFA